MILMFNVRKGDMFPKRGEGSLPYPPPSRKEYKKEKYSACHDNFLKSIFCLVSFRDPPILAIGSKRMIINNKKC